MNEPWRVANETNQLCWALHGTPQVVLLGESFGGLLSLAVALRLGRERLKGATDTSGVGCRWRSEDGHLWVITGYLPFVGYNWVFLWDYNGLYIF